MILHFKPLELCYGTFMYLWLILLNPTGVAQHLNHLLVLTGPRLLPAPP